MRKDWIKIVLEIIKLIVTYLLGAITGDTICM